METIIIFNYSLSFIIDEILIIIFDNDDNSTISFEATEKIYNKFDYSKKKEIYQLELLLQLFWLLSLQ